MLHWLVTFDVVIYVIRKTWINYFSNIIRNNYKYSSIILNIYSNLLLELYYFLNILNTLQINKTVEHFKNTFNNSFILFPRTISYENQI